VRPSTNNSNPPPPGHCEGRSPVAISSLSLEKLEYFDEKKEDKKDKVDEKEISEDNIKNSGDDEK